MGRNPNDRDCGLLKAVPTASGVRVQVRRMLKGSRGVESVRSFGSTGLRNVSGFDGNAEFGVEMT